jgi:hypothetical protein
MRRPAMALSVAVLMISSAASAVWAQSPDTAPDAAKLAKAHQLFVVMHLDTTYAQMTDQLMASVHASEAQMMPPSGQTPAQKAEQAAFEAKLTNLVMSELSWPKLEPDFAKLYADSYTGEQLDGLIAFYSSPLGQTVLAKTPELLRESSELSQRHLTVILPQMQQMIQDEAAKMKAQDNKPSNPSQYK